MENKEMNFDRAENKKAGAEGLLEKLQQLLGNDQLSGQEQKLIAAHLAKLQEQRLNILITGSTGSGKSSTINALFNIKEAKVGTGVNPQTMDIKCYEFANLVLWDSPGLGDGAEADASHSEALAAKLQEKDEKGNLLIDLVLVVLDAASKDLGTSYDLINRVLVPNLGPEAEKRMVIGLNQCDMAMKGRHWLSEEDKDVKLQELAEPMSPPLGTGVRFNTEAIKELLGEKVKANRPDATLLSFLKEKAAAVQTRIAEATGLQLEVVYYSAGYTDEEGNTQSPYNLAKLLSVLVQHTPSLKRLTYVDSLTKEETNWEYNEEDKNYKLEAEQDWLETILDFAKEGSNTFGELGEELAPSAKGLFEVVGAGLGSMFGAIKAANDRLEKILY